MTMLSGQLFRNMALTLFDGEKRTALIWAYFFGQTGFLKWLIANGANTNQQDRVGYTGLHFC